MGYRANKDVAFSRQPFKWHLNFSLLTTLAGIGGIAHAGFILPSSRWRPHGAGKDGGNLGILSKPIRSHHTALHGAKKRVPEPGETTIYMGVDRDIPRQRAFNFALWDKHRKNPERYWYWFEGVFLGSTMMQRLRWPLSVMVFLAFCDACYNIYLAPKGWPQLDLPIAPFNLSGAPLGLLLVFRVTGSNDRYIAARVIWGDIVNVTRDLMQMAHNWSTQDEFNEFASYTILYPPALMCMLRQPVEHDLKIEMDRALGAKSCLVEGDLLKICSRPAGINAPLFIVHKMRSLVKSMSLNPQERFAMEMGMSRLVIDVGACERVLGTPIPVAYTIHTVRFLLIWLSLLPIALTQQLGFGVVGAQLILAFGLLGIEDAGISIEEPFCILPLEAMCNKIAREGRGLLAANAKEMDKGLKEATTMKFEVPAEKAAGGGGKQKGKAKGR